MALTSGHEGAVHLIVKYEQGPLSSRLARAILVDYRAQDIAELLLSHHRAGGISR
jgi:hypothetical protein